MSRQHGSGNGGGSLHPGANIGPTPSTTIGGRSLTKVHDLVAARRGPTTRIARGETPAAAAVAGLDATAEQSVVALGVARARIATVQGLVADRRKPSTGITRPDTRAVNADLGAAAEQSVVGAVVVDDARLGVAAAAAFFIVAGTACKEEEENTFKRISVKDKEAISH